MDRSNIKIGATSIDGQNIGGGVGLFSGKDGINILNFKTFYSATPNIVSVFEIGDSVYLSGITTAVSGIGWSNLLNGTTIAGCGTVSSGGTIIRNTAFGVNTLSSITTGSDNVGVGYNVLTATTIANGNVGVGSFALGSTDEGNYNIGVGYYTLYSNTDGDNNVGVGTNVLFENTNGNCNIGLGYQTLFNNTVGNSNIGIGKQSLCSNINGCNNIGIGDLSLNKNSSGCTNIGLGLQSLNSNVNGCTNIALGTCSLYQNTGGSSNISIGFQALLSNVTGNSNVAIGDYAGIGYNESNRLYISNNASNDLIYGEFDNRIICLNSKLYVNDIPNKSGETNIIYVNDNGLLVKGTPAITAVTNGLTASNNVIKLGGELTEDTNLFSNTPKGFNIYTSNDNSLNNGCIDFWVTDTASSDDTRIVMQSRCIEISQCYGGKLTIDCIDGAVYEDWGIPNHGGIKYAGCYHNSYDLRSIPDVDFVTGITSTIESQVVEGITGATNGLTKTGQDVCLGGTLDAGNTLITKTNNNDNTCLKICLEGTNGSHGSIYVANTDEGGGQLSEIIISTSNACIYMSDYENDGVCFEDGRSAGNRAGIEYAADYSADFVARSLVDAAYVTGKTGSVDLQSVLNVGSNATNITNMCISSDDSNGWVLNTTNTTGVLGVNVGTHTVISYDDIKSASSCIKTFSSYYGNEAYASLCAGIDSGISLRLCAINATGDDVHTMVIASDATGFTGAQYAADYSSNYVNRSLVDKEYVDRRTSGSTSGGITGATNGLTKVGTNVVLGGSLTGDTEITGGGSNYLTISDVSNTTITSVGGTEIGIYDSVIGTSLKVCSGCINVSSYDYGLSEPNSVFKGIVYADDYSAKFTARSLPDVAYVTGLTSGAGTVTGATNLGTGNGTIYTSISNKNIQFKTLSGGTNVTLTCNGNYIGINATGGGVTAFTGLTDTPNNYVDGCWLKVSGNSIVYSNAPSGSNTFENGLTESSGTVVLGGLLTQNTVISGDSNTYCFKIQDVEEFCVSSNSSSVFNVNHGNFQVCGAAGNYIGGESCCSYISSYGDVNTYGEVTVFHSVGNDVANVHIRSSNAEICIDAISGTSGGGKVVIKGSCGVNICTTDICFDAFNIGFFNGTTPIAKPTVTGSKGGNAALASLITALANLGLITDSTT